MQPSETRNGLSQDYFIPLSCLGQRTKNDLGIDAGLVRVLSDSPSSLFYKQHIFKSIPVSPLKKIIDPDRGPDAPTDSRCDDSGLSPRTLDYLNFLPSDYQIGYLSDYVCVLRERKQSDDRLLL